MPVSGVVAEACCRNRRRHPIDSITLAPAASSCRRPMPGLYRPSGRRGGHHHRHRPTLAPGRGSRPRRRRARPRRGESGVRFDLATEPGLVHPCGRRAPSARPRHVRGPYAAAAVRRSAGADGDADVTPTAVRRVLVGPVAADQARVPPLAALRGVLPGVLSSLGADVLVFRPLLDPGSACTTSSPRPTSVVVARPVVAEVHHLAARLSGLRPKALSLLLIGDRPTPLPRWPTPSAPTRWNARSTTSVRPVTDRRPVRRGADPAPLAVARDARAVAEGLAG